MWEVDSVLLWESEGEESFRLGAEILMTGRAVACAATRRERSFIDSKSFIVFGLRTKG